MAYLFKELDGKRWYSQVNDLKKQITELGLNMFDESIHKLNDVNAFELIEQQSGYDRNNLSLICCHRNQGPGWQTYLYESTSSGFGVGRFYHLIIGVDNDALAVQIKLAFF
jgi:hypothetical protein